MSYTVGKLRKRVDWLARLFANQKQQVWIQIKEKKRFLKYGSNVLEVYQLQ